MCRQEVWVKGCSLYQSWSGEDFAVVSGSQCPLILIQVPWNSGGAGGEIEGAHTHQAPETTGFQHGLSAISGT